MPTTYQPYAGDLANLSLGVAYVDIDGPLGDFNDVTYSVDVTTRVIGGGYPKIPQAVVVDNMKATGSVAISEFGTKIIELANDALMVASGLQEMATKDIKIGVYRPLDGTSEITFSGLLLPQLEINFTNGEANSIKLFFEAIAGVDDTSLGTVVTGGEPVGGGAGTFVACPTWLLSPDKVAVGMPSVVSPAFTGQVANATVRVNTEFKRMEFGFPKLCRGLIPLSTTVEIEFTTEEFISATIDTTMTGPVSVSALLVGGTSVTFTAPNCALTGGSPNMSKGDWSGNTFKFTVLMPEGGAEPLGVLA